MMTRPYYYFIFFIFLISCQPKVNEPFQWKNNAQAVICLTYDDGMTSQFQNAIPQLDQFDLKGTFFINSIYGREATVAWKNAGKNGHELANHTLFHPCPIDLEWPKEVTTDFYSVDQILDEIKTVNSILNNVEQKDKARTFAYPCNNTFVGGASYINDLKKSDLVSYARSGQDDPIIITKSFESFNPMEVPSWAVPEGSSFEVMKDYVDSVVQKEGLGIIQFHGIGDEWIKVSKENHLKLVEYLAQQKDKIWVATFAEIMEYIESNKS